MSSSITGGFMNVIIGSSRAIASLRCVSSGATGATASAPSACSCRGLPRSRSDEEGWLACCSVSIASTHLPPSAMAPAWSGARPAAGPKLSLSIERPGQPIPPASDISSCTDGRGAISSSEMRRRFGASSCTTSWSSGSPYMSRRLSSSLGSSRRLSRSLLSNMSSLDIDGKHAGGADRSCRGVPTGVPRFAPPSPPAGLPGRATSLRVARPSAGAPLSSVAGVDSSGICPRSRPVDTSEPAGPSEPRRLRGLARGSNDDVRPQSSPSVSRKSSDSCATGGSVMMMSDGAAAVPSLPLARTAASDEDERRASLSALDESDERRFAEPEPEERRNDGSFVSDAPSVESRGSRLSSDDERRPRGAAAVVASSPTGATSCTGSSSIRGAERSAALSARPASSSGGGTLAEALEGSRLRSGAAAVGGGGTLSLSIGRGGKPPTPSLPLGRAASSAPIGPRLGRLISLLVEAGRVALLLPVTSRGASSAPIGSGRANPRSLNVPPGAWPASPPAGRAAAASLPRLSRGAALGSSTGMSLGANMSSGRAALPLRLLPLAGASSSLSGSCGGTTISMLLLSGRASLPLRLLPGGKIGASPPLSPAGRDAPSPRRGAATTSSPSAGASPTLALSARLECGSAS